MRGPFLFDHRPPKKAETPRTKMEIVSWVPLLYRSMKSPSSRNLEYSYEHLTEKNRIPHRTNGFIRLGRIDCGFDQTVAGAKRAAQQVENSMIV